MVQRTMNKHKTNWNHMLFTALWAYMTVAKIETGFTPFHLIHSEEVFLLIECQILYLHLTIEILHGTTPLEQRLVILECLNGDNDVALQTIEATKKHTKSQYDRKVHPRVFHEGDLVLVYDQTHNILGWGKFKPLWRGPYIFK